MCLRFKNELKQGLLYTNIQHADVWIVRKAGVPGEKKTTSLYGKGKVMYRVDITKHRCKDIGLPVEMWIPNRRAIRDGGPWKLPKGYAASLSVNEMDILAEVPSHAFQKRY